MGIVHQNFIYNSPSNTKCKFIMDSKVLFESVTDPDDTGQVHLQTQMG